MPGTKTPTLAVRAPHIEEDHRVVSVESELGEFLRRQRARLRPEDVGLLSEPGPYRRVPGLRREEVAGPC
jgi:hypothetical protein